MTNIALKKIVSIFTVLKSKQSKQKSKSQNPFSKCPKIQGKNKDQISRKYKSRCCIFFKNPTLSIFKVAPKDSKVPQHPAMAIIPKLFSMR